MSKGGLILPVTVLAPSKDVGFRSSISDRTLLHILVPGFGGIPFFECKAVAGVWVVLYVVLFR